ncbi:MAG: XRE family transcriptional regulator [Alphaproteobacteria bacterium]|nr:XRE family transcriptional regulator [Alphaproteobacteria bacterium]
MSDTLSLATKLGQHLAAIRGDRGYSLRTVEELTNKKVSNAYLNQIENGKIKQPSPTILYSLAQLYKTSYEVLMEKAGYITPKPTKDAHHGKLATWTELNLTEAEEQAAIEFIKWQRQLREKEEKEREKG